MAAIIAAETGSKFRRAFPFRYKKRLLEYHQPVTEPLRCTEPHLVKSVRLALLYGDTRCATQGAAAKSRESSKKEGQSQARVARGVAAISEVECGLRLLGLRCLHPQGEMLSRKEAREVKQQARESSVCIRAETMDRRGLQPPPMTKLCFVVSLASMPIAQDAGGVCWRCLCRNCD